MRDTIDMAREIWESGTGIYEGPNIGQLKAFAALVRADERARLEHNNEVLMNALWKACGDDESVVNATIESQGELK